VRGVKGVANDLEVRPLLDRTDAEIAIDAVRALELRGTVPYNIQPVVHNGHVTLTGRVGRLFHKREAETAVRRIKGVRRIHNHIEVAADAVVRDVRHKIVQALHRNADLDAKALSVTVTGGVATLEGTVTTWQQRDTAERAASDALGIVQVDNRIIVAPDVEPVDELC
jgi:osmotically-inducible protein OsmY